METFTEFKPMIMDPHFQDRRWKYLNKLDIDTLDAPIASLIDDLCVFPFCFTIQSCFGHFIYFDQADKKNVAPLPQTDLLHDVEYRIAYIALCVEKSRSGKEFLAHLKQISEIDPNYIQFGCAEWFWKKSPNSYVLQVEPARHMQKDNCNIDYQEALHVEKVRNQLFHQFNDLVLRLGRYYSYQLFSDRHENTRPTHPALM